MIIAWTTVIPWHHSVFLSHRLFNILRKEWTKYYEIVAVQA